MHDLPESEKVCPHDGTPLEHISSDDHEQLEIIPAKYDIIRLGCSITIPDVILPSASMQLWTHARRKFKEAQDVQSKASAPAPCLRLVGKGKTGKADKRWPSFKNCTPLKKELKTNRRINVIKFGKMKRNPLLKNWMDEGLLRVPPKTAIGKALVYLNNQWDRLIGYVEDGCYPIDNNAAERAIRPFAIGRKNWMVCIIRIKQLLYFVFADFFFGFSECCLADDIELIFQ